MAARQTINRADALVLLLIILVTLGSRAAWFGDPAADFDEQLYSLIGAHMLDGQMPFTDLWDRKPFGLFAIFAFAHAVGGPGPLAYQLLAAAFTVLGSWLVYSLARPLADRVTACGGALLYPLLIYAYGSHSAQSEVFFVPIMLCMLLLVRDMRRGDADLKAALAMLLGGLALQVKYTVVPQCLFLGAVALWHFRDQGPARLITRALSYCLIGLAPTLLLIGLYAVRGDLDVFIHANFLSNFERAAAPIGRFDIHFLQPLAPVIALAAGGIYAAFRLNHPANRGLYSLYAGWSLSVLAGIYLPGTFYSYYFAAFAPCAILLSLPLIDRRGPMRWVPLALVLAGGLAMINCVRHWPESQQNRSELAILAQAIAPHVKDRGHCLMVFDGPAALYRMTGSCLPGRIVYPDHLNNALEHQSLGVDQTQEVARILATRPGAIVTADEPVTEQNPNATALVRQAITQHYRPIGKAQIRGRVIRAWALRD